MKIKKAEEAREYIIEEIKRQFVGPGNGHFVKDVASFQFNPKDKSRHLQEILDISPTNLYMAGILYPQQTLFENLDEKDEEESDSFDEQADKEKDSKDNSKNFKEIENTFDETTTDIDNNRDIDLTNDFKQSAIGLSALVNIPNEIKISINNVGRYHKLTQEFPNELQIICLFLSKFANEKKSYNWFKDNFNLDKIQRSTTHKFLSETFNILENRIKNVEDYFDKYFSNRKGWYQKNKVNPEYDGIYREYGSKDFDNFALVVVNYIKIAQNNNKKNIELGETLSEDQKGYSRESINSSVIFLKKDLLENPFVEKYFKDDKEKEIGLKASITVRPSKYDENTKYLTVAVVNQNKYEKKYSLNKLFFQINFEIESTDGEAIFKNFEDIGLDNLDEEEKSLHLLHHKRENFAIGHGCSVNWKINNQAKCIKLFTEILPVTEVRPIRSKNLPNLYLNMKNFSEDLNFTFKQIENLINQYEIWLSDETKYGKNLSESIFRKASEKNMEHCYKILERIKGGLQILKTDKKIQKAFQLMNQAMYMQQVHYEIKSKHFSQTIDYEKVLSEIKRGNWRPFQICFILLNIKGVHDPESDDREIVDLIWFPTGGGKTEAYLGLSSLVIFYRKLCKKEAVGTAILMRYTLRLLTTQQFQRASTLICACEKIRRNNQEELGTIPISIGLWVGGDVTPNSIKDAQYNLNELYTSELDDPDSVSNKFIILNCPWCNNAMSSSNYKINKKNFLYVCSNKECDFCSDENSLPIKVIDDEIYKNPPTLLIGTIDKFATLPWRFEAIESYDPEKEENFLPPDLIIQDELHLISGPLGSISGMYEIIINAISERFNKDGKLIKAKIIGSTATISKANLQIRNLYARECSIFPPQANKLEDSFFAEEVLDKNVLGRKYVGIFAPSSSSLEVTLAQLISTLNLAGGYLKEYSDENLDVYDPYWTNLIYFNSIRELMKGSSLIDGDANESIRNKWLRKGIMMSFLGDGKSYSNLRRKFENDVEELTSRVDSSQIPKKLKILGLKANEGGNLSACLATNMIQVGIDIGRLSLMTIVGQPKTTSEYIQASSRVGREQEKPGLVLTHLSHTKLRDRSHYEKFSSYHQNLYKYVEPTSVTSHSDPVRKRCLHAIVIFLVRFWSKKHRKTPLIPDEKLMKKIKHYIIKHVEKSDFEHKEEIKKTENEIDYIFEKWISDSPEVYGSIGSNISKSAKSVLMKPSGSEQQIEGKPFDTPTSMRNVDRECVAEIMRVERK